MPSGAKYIQHSPSGLHPGLVSGEGLFWETTSPQEYGHCIASRVGRDLLENLNAVISKVVM